MKKSRSNNNKYSNEHLCCDTLVTIFMALNVVDLAVVSRVCKSWYQASREPALWNKVDLSGMTSHFGIPKTLEAWSDKHSSTRMTQFLKYALDLSNGKTNCLIFNFYVYLRDVHLISAAQRTPELKRLVLPISGRLSKLGIDIAMMSWRGLESITITSMINHQHILSAIGKYCKNIFEVKFTRNFDHSHADALIKYTPKLKALSIRTLMVNMTALCRILKFLEHLEVVNICHSLLWDRPNGTSLVLYNVRDLRKDLDISYMRKLLFCQRKRCIKCKNANNNTGSEDVYDFLEVLWRQDEIHSLAH